MSLSSSNHPTPPYDTLDRSVQKLGLDRMHALLPELGRPERACPVIHVAGTNGKGSVVAMLAQILGAQGYRVGAFTSPHLMSVRERIQLNGQPITPADFSLAATRLWNWLLARFGPPVPGDGASPWPTYFEFMTLLAFQTFAQARADVALVEVGLGGRLDATNVFDKPLVTVITSIGWDHMEFLGDTLEAIAREKAAILRPGVPVVVGPQLPDEALEEITSVAHHRDSSVLIEASSEALHRVSSRLSTGRQTLRNLVSGESLELNLLGSYQRHNLATVLATVDVLRREGLRVSQDALRTGLREVVWPARFQVRPDDQLVVDGSHNTDGFATLRTTLHECFQPGDGLYWLVSLKANRDPQLLVDLINHAPVTPLGIVTTTPSQQKPALFHEAGRLRQLLRLKCPRLGTRPVWASDCPATGLMLLQQWVGNQATHPEQRPWGLVTGSLYTAGEVLGLLADQTTNAD